MSPQVGDKMVVSRGPYSLRTIVTVTKVTPSGQFTCNNGERYTSSGQQVGDANRWFSAYAVPADEQTIVAVQEEHDRHKLVDRLERLTKRDWKKTPIEDVRRLLELLP